MKTTRAKIAIISFLLIVLGLLSAASANAIAIAPSDVTWSAEITVPFTAEQMLQPGWADNTQTMLTALTARVSSHGARLSTRKQATASQTTEYTLALSGAGTLAQVKQILFDDLTPVGGLLGGAAELTLSGAVQANEPLTLALESNPSTGYAWSLATYDPGFIHPADASTWQTKSNLPGAPATQNLTLPSTTAGNLVLTLTYRRAWETNTPITRRVSLQATQLATLTDLINPAPVVKTSAPSFPDLPVRAPEAVQAPPATYDMRALGQVPAIRDQSSCGSCWAFATVAPFESALMIKDHVAAPNLSEQYLISCNKSGWSCNGGWFAHDYHMNTLGYNQTAAGAVTEAAFPYLSANGTCSLSYTHTNKLNNWYFISGYNIPDETSIKNAIMNYGAVAVTVCVGNAFQAYRGGIFATDEGSVCGSSGLSNNHAVALVGWNDTEGTWILRNSWNTWWGESGYMRIKRNVSYVGYAANYVIYGPSCYSLGTSVTPSAGGTVTVNTAPNCNGTQYMPNTAISLSASPKSGYSFFAWDDNTSNLNRTLAIAANTTATGYFTTPLVPRIFAPLMRK